MNLRISDRLLLGLYLSAEVRSYPADRLFLWTPAGYSRRKFRDLTARLVRKAKIQQVISSGQVNFRLSATGKNRVMARFPKLSPVSAAWDGFWRVVIFDIPENKRKDRDALRRRLIRMGFGRLQDSVYLSYYDWDEALLPATLFLEAKQKHLGEPKVFAAKVWQLNQLAAAYNRIIDRLTTRFGIKEAKKREEFLRKIHQLYLEAVFTDPLLPAELLPADWPAAKCRKFLLQAALVKG